MLQDRVLRFSFLRHKYQTLDALDGEAKTSAVKQFASNGNLPLVVFGKVVAVAGLGQLQNLGNGLAQSTWRILTVDNFYYYFLYY